MRAGNSRFPLAAKPHVHAVTSGMNPQNFGTVPDGNERLLLDTGGKIVIDTINPRAVTAIHEFLGFQITEHQTGDPMKPSRDDVKRH